jgi:hypothetical protein
MFSYTDKSAVKAIKLKRQIFILQAELMSLEVAES